jgi:1,4-alpha-glucan branching enzyme/maltooligosyltrehalose trehalohydrolase
VGNRAFGERIAQVADPAVLRAGVMCLLLAPSIPMLFMGEEFDAATPFLYFCDFGPDLAEKVRVGRRREFAEFGHGGAEIPDPNAPATFQASKLDWRKLRRPGHREWLALYRDLLALRRTFIVPHLAGTRHSGRFEVQDGSRLAVDWVLPDGAGLALRANFSASAWLPDMPAGVPIYRSAAGPQTALAPCGVTWVLDA